MLRVCKMSRLIRLIKSSMWQLNCLIVYWLNGRSNKITYLLKSLDSDCVSSFIFNCTPPDIPNVPLNFLSTLHRHPFQYASKKQTVPLSTESPSSLPSLSHLSPYRQSSAYLTIRLKYLWWRHLLDSLSGGWKWKSRNWRDLNDLSVPELQPTSLQGGMDRYGIR